MTKRIIICPGCGEEKPHRAKGLCLRCYSKAYYELHKEEIDARKKVYNKENIEKIAVYKKVYYEENRDHIETRKKVYNKENKEVISAWQKVYYEENKEAITSYKKVWQEENRDHIAARTKVYYEENIEKIAAYKKVYSREHPRERRTYLLPFGDPDCYVWNKWFEGAEGHHLAWDEGVYIPATLHRSVSHSINQDKNMDVINTLAMEWLQGIRRESPQTTLDAFG